MQARAPGRPRKPLEGCRVLITRTREQAESLRVALERKGASVIELPTIALAPPRSWRPLDSALHRLDQYDWIIFTSSNGVEQLFGRLQRVGKKKGASRRARRPLGPAKIAAIGPATAAALRRHGVRAHVVPREFRAEGLLAALRDQPWRGRRVLLARAAEAREILPLELRRRGARVDVVAAYRTVLPHANRRRLQTLLRRRPPDVITFTSSSTVRNLCALLGGRQARRLLTGVAIASIGPITSRTARHRGLRVAVEAKSYTIAGLVRAIEQYVETEPSR